MTSLMFCPCCAGFPPCTLQDATAHLSTQSNQTHVKAVFQSLHLFCIYIHFITFPPDWLRLWACEQQDQCCKLMVRVGLVAPCLILAQGSGTRWAFP